VTLVLADVSAAYRGRTVFRSASLSVPPGEVVGLLGPNGAGKTTLLRVAAGLIRPVSGRVQREGAPAYFGGEMTMPGGCRVDRWSRLIGAHETSRQWLGRLSRGTRQMVGLRAWLGRDDWTLGLLDEPWEGLDPDGARWLREVIAGHRARGAALVVSSHRLHDVAEACDAYAFLGPAGLRVVRPGDLDGERVDASVLMRLFDDLARSR
jgi:ABC-2 type transport system ATP-binding protein